MEALEGLFSEINVEGYKNPKLEQQGQEIPKDSSWQNQVMLLFLKDLLHSEKAENSLRDGVVIEPAQSQDTSFDYSDEGNSVRNELSYVLSVPNTSFRLCSVSSASPEKITVHVSQGKEKLCQTVPTQ